MHSFATNLQGQLNAQDKLAGGEYQFECVKDAHTVRHWQPCYVQGLTPNEKISSKDS